jgi:hypothetical protein
MNTHITILIVTLLITLWIARIKNVKERFGEFDPHKSEHIDIPNFSIFNALTTKYSNDNIVQYDNTISSNNNYKFTNGNIVNIYNNLTIDLASFNDNNLSFFTILRNNTQNDVNLKYILPKYDTTTLQNEKKITYIRSENNMTLTAGRSYSVSFLPILPVVKVESIDSTNYDKYNNQIINLNNNFILKTEKFNSQFNLILYYSGNETGFVKLNNESAESTKPAEPDKPDKPAKPDKSDKPAEPDKPAESAESAELDKPNKKAISITPNTFYLIQNNNINNSWDNHTITQLSQYAITQLN